MNRFLCRTLVFCFLAAALATPSCLQAQAAQAPAASASAKQDYSKEPFIIESITAKIVYQNDGTYIRDDSARILIQSNAGLQAWGVLHFPYASASGTTDVTNVRVTKPDGSVLQTAPSDVMEVTPDVSREAPTYSDLKEKQLPVKGLQVGDRLEFQSRTEVKTPLIPGQFWYSQEFLSGVVVLQEELQISVPRDRYVQVKNGSVQPVTRDEGGARIYDWKTAQLDPTTDESQKAADDSEDDKFPDVQLTSFHSWDEVGQWFKSVAEPQAAVTPAIKAKADAVTMSAASYNDKVRALYDFVSTRFRYVAISFGIGRYQPHTAADVLNNGFGDCKDKDTLFTALLAAENIKAVPLLINSSAKIDPDVPSPGQFDHVITALQREDGFQFLDTTPEVAPYGMLMFGLRDKQALLMPADGPAKLVQTPKDPPFRPFEHFSAVATLDDSGTLSSNDTMTTRGDNEVFFRLVLRQAGPAKWNDTMQAIMSNLGFGGTVTEANANSPEATDVPFEINFHYNRKDYSDWADRQITPPIPPFILPAAPDDSTKKPKPIKIGAPMETDYRATVKLPDGSAPSLPVAVNLHESFADYTSTYLFADGTLQAERRLTTKVTEIPVDQIEAYRAFTKAIGNDEDSYIALRGGSILRSSSIAAPQGSQGTPEAREFLSQAQSAFQKRDAPAALDAAQHAVDADPKFSMAWFLLGTLQIAMNQQDAGVASLKKSIQLDPNDPGRYDLPADELVRTHHEQGALEIWRALETTRPGEPHSAQHAADILMRQKQYADAAKELEPVQQQNPQEIGVMLELGEAYVHLPDKEKGAQLLMRAGDQTHDAAQLNNAAWYLADNGLHLDAALRYSQGAVQQVESATAKISLGALKLADIRTMPTIASDWDTLGWVHFQMGHLDLAEKYLDAAWKLTENPQAAAHLGQVYEKQGKKHEAALAYANALASTGDVPEGTDKRLDDLQKGQKFQDQVRPDPIKLQDLRTTKIPWKVTSSLSAEFFLLFAPGAKPEAMFVSGSEELRDAAGLLENTHFDVSFPDDNPARILRRGLMSCGPASSKTDCLFVMFPPASVNSVK